MSKEYFSDLYKHHHHNQLNLILLKTLSRHMGCVHLYNKTWDNG